MAMLTPIENLAGLRAVYLYFGEGRRLVLHPEGGVEAQAYVPGVKWVLDDEGVTDAECIAVIRAAKQLANDRLLEWEGTR